MPVLAVVCGQWGDEGKGKIIDLLAGRAHVVVRAQGGDNAGHTVVNPRGKFALHLVPAGIFNEQTRCLIGPGVALFDIQSRADGRSKVVVSHEKLPSQEAGTQWRSFWNEWLTALDAAD